MTTYFLHGTEVIEIDEGTRPIRTVKSSIIGLVGSAAMGPVNTPVLIKGSARKAVEIFGGKDGMGTLPDALDAILRKVGAMVVCINVCDPATHKTAMAEADYVLPASGKIVLPKGHVSLVTVKNSAGTTTYVVGDDYTVDAAAGTISRVADGDIAALSTLKIAFTYVDPTKVAMADIIGGFEDSDFSGIEALRAAQSVVHVTPRILIAPGFTGSRPEDAANPAIGALLGVANRLRGVVIADGPNTTEEAAITHRDDWGSNRLYIVDPAVTVFDTFTGANKQQPASIHAAALLAKTDQERGFWWSPSNQLLEGIVGTSRPIDFALSDPNCVANYLNENEVATIIRMDGFRLWGNRTCSADPKWAFLSVRRTADMIYESIEQGHLWAMDRPFSAQLLIDIAEGVNAYLRDLKARGAILGGTCWLDPELNTKEIMEAGQTFYDFDIEPAGPMERLTFRAHRNNGYYEELVAQVAQAA
jgi:phage tail sheath protein FI